MESQHVLIADLKLLKKFHLLAERIDKSIENLILEKQKLTELKDLLLSKLATIEN